MSKLYFRYSAMGAGKSLDLLKVAYNYTERGMRPLIFNSKLDSRFAKNQVASRTGLKMDAISFDSSTDMMALLDGIVEKVDCILVDEAQFLTKKQVSDLRTIATLRDLPVICYGLRTDFKTELFEGSKWLLSWADSIEELKTVCWCGKKATLNARVMNGEIVKTGEQIQIGGNELYVAICWKHYMEGKLS